MQISGVNNITFKSEQAEADNQKQFLRGFVSLSDKDLMSIAKTDVAQDKNPQKMQKFYTNMIVGMSTLDSTLAAASTSGKLAAKTGVFATTMGSWLGIMGLAMLYSKASNFVNKHVPFVRKAEEKFPIAKSIFDIALFVGAASGVSKLLNKAKAPLKKKFPGIVSDLSKLKSNVASKINKSFVSKKIYKPIASYLGKFAADNPKFTNALKSGSRFIVPVVALASVVSLFSLKSKYSNEVNQNFETLRTMRDDLRENYELIS